MTCYSPLHHIWYWSDNIIMPWPPEGLRCVCGAVIADGYGGAIVMSPEGVCGVCGKPLDDHPGANPCA